MTEPLTENGWTDSTGPVDGDPGQDGQDPAGERSKTADEIGSLYDEYAGRLARFDRLDRLFTGRFRRRQFGDATGRVLDVACGTGTNFPYLPADVDLVGIDVSRDVLEVAGDRISALDLDGEVRRMDAQNLAFEDDSFDTVISALSTCTFPDPGAALREMARVCRPDGRILLFEHGKSDARPIAPFQEWRSEAHYEKMGCRWTQEPLAVVSGAGLRVEDHDSALFGILTSIEASPP